MEKLRQKIQRQRPPIQRRVKQIERLPMPSKKVIPENPILDWMLFEAPIQI